MSYTTESCELFIVNKKLERNGEHTFSMKRSDIVNSSPLLCQLSTSRSRQSCGCARCMVHAEVLLHPLKDCVEILFRSLRFVVSDIIGDDPAVPGEEI